jgi:hypothetical protein
LAASVTPLHPERVRPTLPPAAKLPDPQPQLPLQLEPEPEQQPEPQPQDGDTAVHHLLMHEALRPQFLPEPPLPERGPSFVGAAVRILLAFGFVAGAVCLVIFGVLPFAQWSELTRTDVAAPSSTRGAVQPAALRLVLDDLSARKNEALPLSITVTGSSAGAFVAIEGLAPGTRLTAGSPAAMNTWRIPVRDLAKAVVLPPHDFVGTMKLLVDLRLSDDSITDSRAMNLEWVSSASAAPAMAPPNASSANVPSAVPPTRLQSPVVSPATAFSQNPPRVPPATAPLAPVAAPAAFLPQAAAPAAAMPQTTTPAPVAALPQQPLIAAPPQPQAVAPPAPARQLTPPMQASGQQKNAEVLPPLKVRELESEEIAILLKRGEELLSQGDIAAARLALQRAAEARDARAALVLGATYDPVMLSQIGVLGFQPDPAKARLWYQRAAEMGSTDASRRLDRLTQQETAR